MNYAATDKRCLWHPFTQMQDWVKEDILIIKEGRGSYLYDLRGRAYLDGVSSLWCNVHGHHKRELNEAIQRQLNKVAHSTMLGLSHVPAIELAQQLVKIVPRGLTRVFYSDDGSTAVEIALKIAFQYWKQIPGRRTSNAQRRTKFLSFANAYHGDTIGSVSLGGMDLFHRTYQPLLFKTIKAPAPYCYRCPLHLDRYSCGQSCLVETERLMRRHQDQLAAVVIEPLIQGAAGMLTQPRGFLKTLRRLCDKYGILLIADEVATGFGRTGRMFACEHEGVTPDIMTVAKGITGGYLPLAATLTTEKIFRAFLGKPEEGRTFYHGHTYTGNPLACAAALANLKLFRQERTLVRLAPKIKFLTRELTRFVTLKHVGDIRQCGFMVGIELVKNRLTKEPYPAADRLGHRVIREARGRGVILRPLGDVIVLMPPLSISWPELTILLKVTYDAIKSVTEPADGPGTRKL